MAPPPVSSVPRHRVVIVGSGFGGLFAARRLSGAPVEVTVVDRTTHHLFQPLLYQVATGILSQGDIAPTTREVLRRQRNARVVLRAHDHDAAGAGPARAGDRSAGPLTVQQTRDALSSVVGSL